MNEVRGQWRTLELRLPSPDDYAAMSRAYALFIQLYQEDAEKVPVSGKVYLDNVGFILR